MLGILSKLYLFVLFSIIFFSPLILLYTSLEGFVFIILCILSFVIVASPMFIKSKVEIDQPIVFILMSVLFGITLRGPYFLFTEDRHIRDFFMLGESIDFFIFPTFLLVIGLAIMMVGYSLKPKPWNLLKYRLFRKTDWSENRIIILSVFGIIASMYGIYLYFELLKTSILELDVSTFSKARFIEIEGSDVRGSAGYVRLLGGLARPIFFITLLYFLAKRKSIFSVIGVLMIFSLIASLALPILLSTRVQVIYIAFSAGLIWSSKRKVSGRTWVMLLLVIGLVFSVLTSYRNREITDYSDIWKSVNLFSVVESVVDNRNLLGVSKNAHIINNVPEREPHAWGWTVVNWVVTPIPRSLWPSKPSALTGGYVRDHIYQHKYGGGIPPGIVAELYWNFSYIGIFLMFFIGRFFKKIYLSFKPLFATNDNAVLVYFLVLPSIVDLLFGNGINYAILRFMQDFLPLIPILMFIRK